MGDLTTCLKLTEDLLEEFNKGQSREELIGNINRLLDKRGALLASLKPPFSPEEQLLGKKIAALDKRLKPLLEETLLEIRQDIKQTVKKKTSMKKYINPYQSLQLNDGRFYDRKR
ncbi:flagellar protein FliT [Weizmannia acidilactici]|nr:flagellar protein FliT [Weizmannia acidilactici]